MKSRFARLFTCIKFDKKYKKGIIMTHLLIS